MIVQQSIPLAGFTFSFASTASFLNFGLTSISESSSFISTSSPSLSLAELELGAPLLGFALDENASFDCFGGAVVPLGFEKNLLSERAG
jgi:hypothetical protein